MCLSAIKIQNATAWPGPEPSTAPIASCSKYTVAPPVRARVAPGTARLGHAARLPPSTVTLSLCCGVKPGVILPGSARARVRFMDRGTVELPILGPWHGGKPP